MLHRDRLGLLGLLGPHLGGGEGWAEERDMLHLDLLELLGLLELQSPHLEGDEG